MIRVKKGVRRRGRVLSTIVGASVAMALTLSGCAAGGDDADGDAATASVIKGALQSSFGPLDPHTASNAISINLFSYIFETLYRADPTDPTVLTPQLAVGEPEQIDDTTYRIKIREGVSFHDGSPLTASDVVFSFQRILDPDLGSLFAKYLTNVASVTADDNTTVTFELVAPSSLFMQRISLVRILPESVITSADADAALSTAPIGSGPYSAHDAQPDAGIVLERYEDYDGPTTAATDRIEFEVVGDANARVSGLQSNSFDAIANVQYLAAPALDANGDVEVGTVPGYTAHEFLLNGGKAPFDDVRVRQALMYSLDREDIVDTAYLGNAEVANSQLPQSSSAYQEPATIYTTDLDKAAGLLTEAGYSESNPVTFELQVGVEIDGLLAAAQIMQEQLQATGLFKVDIRQGEQEALYSRVTDGSYQAFYATATPGLFSADAEFAYRWLYYGAIPTEFVYWSDPGKAEVEALLDQAAVAVDEGEYASLMQQVVDITAESGPIIPVVQAAQITAWNDAAASSVAPSPLGGIYIESAD